MRKCLPLMHNADIKISKLKISSIGKFFYYFLPYRKQIILKNINIVYGDLLKDYQKKILVKAFYSHLLKCIQEIIKFRFLGQNNLKNNVKIKGHEKLFEIAKQGKGFLILTGHFGNWEVAPIGGILNFKEFQGKFHFIRRTLSNKFLEKFLFKRYYDAGLNVIPKKNSLHLVRDALEKNEGVVFVMDQHASLANKDGIAVEFFGKMAGTYRSLASLARYTGAPVVPAAGFRLANGEHVLEFYEPIYWEEYDNLQESIYQNTLKYNQALEKIILEHPEQWLWLHKRWKLK